MDTQNVEEMENNVETAAAEATETSSHNAPYAKFEVPDPIVEVNDLNLYYGSKQALKNIYMDIPKIKPLLSLAPLDAENPHCCAALIV